MTRYVVFNNYFNFQDNCCFLKKDFDGIELLKCHTTVQLRAKSMLNAVTNLQPVNHNSLTITLLFCV